MTKDSDNKIVIDNKDIESLIGSINKNNSLKASRIINEVINYNSNDSIDSIWHQPIGSLTNWILLLNGINNSDEEEIAKSLLVWREFYAGPDSQIRCIQSSDRKDFAICCRLFDITSPPALIFSDDPQFKKCLTIDGSLLKKFCSGNGNLQRFITRIHTGIILGKSLDEINDELTTESFWDKINLIYKEVKGLISIKVTT